MRLGTDAEPGWSFLAADGTAHFAGIRADGTLWEWGELLDGVATSPRQVGADAGWIVVDPGAAFTAALRAAAGGGRTLWTWGADAGGQLGRESVGDDTEPVQAGSATDWAAVSAGGAYAIALRAEPGGGNTLWSWGTGLEGQLGLGGDVTLVSTPSQVGSDSDWASISATTFVAAAVKADGRVYTSGARTRSTTTCRRPIGANQFSPYEVPSPRTGTGWRQLAAGDSSMLGLLSDGSAWSWGGTNVNGELGVSDVASCAGVGHADPARPGVVAMCPVHPEGQPTKTWRSVSAAPNSFTRFAIDEAGGLWSWGGTDVGQVGAGHTYAEDLIYREPVPVPIGADATRPWATDFLPLTRTVELPAGAVSATVAVTVVDDAVDEPDETVQATISVASGAVALGVATATGTIIDDDTVDVPGCTVTGTPADDTLIGTAGNDVICGGNGNDVIRGLGGNDRLLGGDGTDELQGGAGTDVIDGGAGTDVIVHADATSRVVVDLVGATARVGNSVDTLIAIEDATGTRFADVLWGDGGANRLRGLGADDVLGPGGGTGDVVDGGPGSDQLDLSRSPVETFTDLGAGRSNGWSVGAVAAVEDVRGSEQRDTILGSSGSNRLQGLGGDDLITGGAGSDTISGAEGADTVFGSDGNDTLTGGPGSDAMYGGGGADTMYGNEDADTMHGDGGDDTVYGMDGNDQLFGELGADTLFGGVGVNRINGGLNRDTCLPAGADLHLLRGHPRLNAAEP